MQIGKIKVNNPVVLAPMEAITDIPFRLIARRLGADWVYTEFASSDAIVRSAEKILRSIRILPEERPVGIQLFGSNPDTLEQAVKIVDEKFHPDFIDLNGGCWSKRHALRGEGAGVLQDIPNLERILHRMVKATKLPVTFKTRLGWDEKKIVILDVAKIAADAGIRALTVHCRTRCQGYKGKADWAWLEKIKKVIRIPLIGNGDIVTPEDAKRIFDLGCDGVMIGRGAIANPWIFQQVKDFVAAGIAPVLPSVDERIKVCMEHLRLTLEHRGPKWGIFYFRKYYAGYFRGLPGVSSLRAELMKTTDLEEVKRLIGEFRKELEN